MKIIPISEQPLEERCLNLDNPNIDGGYLGQDSIVYRVIPTNQAIHVYYSHNNFSKVKEYAKNVNTVAQALEQQPFRKEIQFENETYSLELVVNPRTEVGEKQIDDTTRAYTLSPFIDGLSLCWPNQAQEDEQRAVAKSVNILFYDEFNEYLETISNVKGIDINPINVKYRIDKKNKTLTIIVTDLAKNINNINNAIFYPTSSST